MNPEPITVSVTGKKGKPAKAKVEGFTIIPGAIAVTPSVEEWSSGWNITHVPTGLAAGGGFRRRGDAVFLALEIGRHADLERLRSKDQLTAAAAFPAQFVTYLRTMMRADTITSFNDWRGEPDEIDLLRRIFNEGRMTMLETYEEKLNGDIDKLQTDARKVAESLTKLADQVAEGTWPEDPFFAVGDIELRYTDLRATVLTLREIRDEIRKELKAQGEAVAEAQQPKGNGQTPKANGHKNGNGAKPAKQPASMKEAAKDAGFAKGTPKALGKRRTVKPKAKS